MACGRIGFGPRAAGDATVVDGPPSCDWSRGPTFSAMHAYPELDSPQYEADPFLAPGDPLTLYFSSFRNGHADIYVAHRAAVGASFAPPTPLTTLNTPNGDEDSFYLAAGGATGYYSWTVTPGTTTPQIYEVISQGGGLATGRRVSEIDDAFAGDHYNPWPSPDNLELSFAAGPSPSYHIYFATRSDTASPWGSFTEFPDTRTQPAASGATLTVNRLVIVWSQGPHGNSQLFYATRASVSDAFGPPVPLPFSTAAFDDNTPQIRDDGCELFYAHALATQQWDLVSVDVTP